MCEHESIHSNTLKLPEGALTSGVHFQGQIEQGEAGHGEQGTGLTTSPTKFWG